MNWLIDVAARRDKHLSQQDTVLRPGREITDSEIEALLAWTDADIQEDKRLPTLTGLWERIDVVTQLNDLIPFPLPDKPR